MNRRDFFRGVAGAVAVGAFPHHLFASPAAKKASDQILLGPRKIGLSRLAMGTGTVGWGGSSNQTRKLGLHGLADLLRAGLDDGINFWDSADQYGSHPHIREALKTVAREKVVIMTKTHAKTEKEMRADLDRFRKELGTDVIDILLLHCMTEDDWNVTRRGAMDVIAEAQEKGIVRTRGVSCHTLGALRTAAREPWVEVDLARINPDRIEMDAAPNTVLPILRDMKKQGKGVIGMKILGAGKLRDEQDRALQYSLSLDCIDCFTIGSENRDEMEDLVRRIPAASTRA